MSLQAQSETFKLISKELQQALKHSQICEKHFDANEVPPACAHAFALEGHLTKIEQLLNSAKILHASKASI